MASDDDRRLVTQNRRARHDYHILDRLEAGIELRGPEVKSLRAGRANLAEAFATVRRGEVFLHQCHIAPYEPATRENVEPLRDRKLLLHRREIDKLESKVREKGVTLVPLSLYFRGGRAKVELALARGKHTYDKRHALKEKQDERETRRALRGRGSGSR